MSRQFRSDVIHVWYTVTADCQDPRKIELYQSLLEENEIERYNSFRFDRDRHLYLVSHALLRTTLSQFGDAKPAEWQFAQDPFGKPYISSPARLQRLRFNISHCHGLAACGVTLDNELGIDVEPVDTKMDLNFADQYLSPEELHALSQCTRESQHDIFFQYWTLKEAYLKARGVGLSIPLVDFTIFLAPQADPTIGFSSRLSDDPMRWQFVQSRPTEKHVLGMAVSVSPGDRKRIVLRRCVP